MLLLVSLACSTRTMADTLILSDRLVYGRLVSIGLADVTFATQCGPTQKFPRSAVQQVQRNGSCKPKPIRPSSAGGDLCRDVPLELTEVQLRDPVQTFDVSEFAMFGGRIHLRSADGATQFHGSDKRFVSMRRSLVCRNEVRDIASLPGFCKEDTQHAINFGSDALFPNRILTRGISFYLEDDRGSGIDRSDQNAIEIRLAFGNAVTQWMGALQDLGNDLPTAVRPVLNAMISHSPNGYTMLAPPQVVQVGCRDTAMFVVRFVADSAKSMVIDGRVKAARAELKGRTIWINGKTYPCWKADLTQNLWLPQQSLANQACANLTPIIAHELGHAFGLVGHQNLPGASIMDTSLRIAYPTHADALSLANILLQPTTGSAAGRMDMDAAGVELIQPRR